MFVLNKATSVPVEVFEVSCTPTMHGDAAPSGVVIDYGSAVDPACRVDRGRSMRNMMRAHHTEGGLSNWKALTYTFCSYVLDTSGDRISGPAQTDLDYVTLFTKLKLPEAGDLFTLLVRAQNEPAAAVALATAGMTI